MAVASVGRRGLWSIPLAAIGVATIVLTPSFNGGAAVAVAGRSASADVCPPALSPDHPIPTTAEGLNCQAANRPGDARELASLRSMLQARETAPFATAARGAFASAVSQSNSLPLSTLAGGSSSWTPAGPSVLCDGHTDNSNLCPLVNNTSVQESNGDYTISALGHKTLSGRMDALAGDPTNPNRLFAAPAVGGVFETTDAGGHWHSIGDSLPTQAMGALVYDTPFHRIIAGSGDPSFGGSGIQGHGIFFSDNDGATWQTAQGIPDLSLSFRVVVSPADSSGKTVYAATSMGLFRSTDGGVHYVNETLSSSPAGYTVPDPTQGGKQVSCAGNTTAPLCFFANIVTDVVVKKSSSANAPAGAVMAVLGWRAGQKVDVQADNSTPNTSCKLSGAATNCLQAPQNGIYTSDSGAPGSFTFQSHAGSSAGLDFAPDDVVGRTSLGIADGAGQNNDAVFALVQDAIKLRHCADDPVDADVATVCEADVQALGYATVLDGAYATYDFGKTWTKIMNFSQLHQGGNTALIGVPGYSPGVQAWYNNWIKPDPTATDSSGNPTRVVFGLEEIWENNVNLPGVLSNPWVAYQGQGGVSPWVVIGRYWNDCGGLNTTGGLTCNPTTSSSSAQPYSTTHPDQHAYLFVPDGSGGVTLYAGNDGGAYKQHVASGVDFSNDNWGDGVNNGLYSLQPYDAEVAKDGTIVSGLQDNGEMKIAPGGREAHTIFGGDGFMTMIDPNNSQNIVEEYTYGVTALTLNGGKDWYNIDFGCGSSNAQFSTSLEQDPTMPGHAIEGCTHILEAGGGAGGNATIFANPCAAPPGADPFQCQASNVPWTSVFDLGYASSPGSEPTSCQVNDCGPFNIPSALGVRGEAIYAGYCGFCDVVTGGLPFHSGIATNVGGDKPPAIGSGDGWHFASAHCSGCGTANGLLPQRYISSVQIDPGNTKTIYVTLGGYARRWIPPGALGDDVSNVGYGHVFVSHDAGENFTDISGNLPDIAANWTLIHNGALLVATDLGVYVAPTTAGKAWSVLGTGLPNAPVFTLRTQPGNPDRVIAATYGRGVQQYDFNGVAGVTTTPSLPTTASGAAPASTLPNTGPVPAPAWPALFGIPALAVGARLRRRRALRG